MLKAEFRVDGTTHEGCIVSLGDGGAFLATPSSIDSGVRGFLRYRDAGGELVLHKATVRRTQSAAEGLKGVALKLQAP